MSKSKSYNRIVFLTTLSVYLGLVIVGSSPQVLAQTAATTSGNYNLTAKRDGVSIPDASKLEFFLGKVGRLVKDGKINLDRPVHLKFQLGFDNGNIPDGSLSYSTDSNQPVLLDLLKDFVSTLDESHFLRAIVDESKGEKINGLDVDLNLAQNDAVIKGSFHTDSVQTSENLKNHFEGIFRVVALYRREFPEADFYRNANLSFKDNQFFIVTRMPRASLEAYLKNNAK